MSALCSKNLLQVFMNHIPGDLGSDLTEEALEVCDDTGVSALFLFFFFSFLVAISLTAGVPFTSFFGDFCGDFLGDFVSSVSMSSSSSSSSPSSSSSSSSADSSLVSAKKNGKFQNWRKKKIKNLLFENVGLLVICSTFKCGICSKITI